MRALHNMPSIFWCVQVHNRTGSCYNECMALNILHVVAISYNYVYSTIFVLQRRTTQTSVSDRSSLIMNTLKKKKRKGIIEAIMINH